MKTQSGFAWKNLVVPAIVMLAFWGVAVFGRSQSGYLQPIFMFGYIGTALGVGLGLYGVLPKLKKPLGRRLTLFLVGAFLVIFSRLSDGRTRRSRDWCSDCWRASCRWQSSTI